MFLDEQIKFLEIPKVIEKVCDRFSDQNTATPSLEDILESDRWARQAVIEAAKDSSPTVVLTGS